MNLLNFVKDLQSRVCLPMCVFCKQCIFQNPRSLKFPSKRADHPLSISLVCRFFFLFNSEYCNVSVYDTHHTPQYTSFQCLVGNDTHSPARLHRNVCMLRLFLQVLRLLWLLRLWSSAQARAQARRGCSRKKFRASRCSGCEGWV